MKCNEIDNGDGTITLDCCSYIEPACATSCLICGKSITGHFHLGIGICDECKQAVAWAKEKMMRKNKNKSRKRAKIEQLPGQVDMFTSIIKNKEIKV